MKREIEAYFLLQYNIVKSNHPPVPSYSRISRRHQLLSPNPLPLFNSSSPATTQKPLPPIRHICGLGASVECSLHATKITNIPYWGQWLLCCGWRRWIKQGEEIWGQKLISSAYSRMTGNRGDYLADWVIYLILRLFEKLGYGEYDLTTYRYRDKKLTF